MTTGGYPTDATLLEAWMGGDAQAGVALVRRHYDAVFAFHANKVGLDDAVQSVPSKMPPGLVYGSAWSTQRWPVTWRPAKGGRIFV